jgi:multidrug efflux pump subunit AcrA (membrane-fusion protein)
MNADAHQLADDSNVSDSDWLDFEATLSDLARIAKSDASFDRVVHSLLEKTVQLLAAVGGAVWLGSRPGSLKLECQWNFGMLNGAVSQDFHHQLLEHVRTEGEILVVPPGGITIGRDTLANPTDFSLLIAPLRMDQEVVGLFEVVQRRSTSPAVLHGNRRLLSLVCELAADHLRRQELRRLHEERLHARQFEQFIQLIHGSLHLRTVAYEIVNVGRQIIGCDRVSLAIRKGPHFRLAAVSSVDSLNRRSRATRRLEALAGRVANAADTVWYDGQHDESLAPQIIDSLQQFADEVHPRAVGLIPLSTSPNEKTCDRDKIIGVLIVEQFASLFDHATRNTAQHVARHGALALANALHFESLPTLPFARHRKAPLGQRTVRPMAALLGVTAIGLLLSLLVVPVDFHIRARGELQPQEQQHVFAPLDGQVATIHVQHGQQVAAGEVLLELRSPELELELKRLQGEVEVTLKRISALESSLLQLDVSAERDINRMNQLAAEQEEARQLLASQRDQLALLDRQQEKLVLRSPLSGRVLTWDLEQLLSDRPVQRGQSLLSVANLDGPWLAELEVPDDQIGHVLRAIDEPNPINVSFQLATNRGPEHHGVIRRVATRTETTKDERPVVRVTIDVDEATIDELRPGATIFARIHCGQRSAAYVLFHDLLEAVLNWIPF